jgi:hypothetical protein
MEHKAQIEYGNIREDIGGLFTMPRQMLAALA